MRIMESPAAAPVAAFVLVFAGITLALAGIAGQAIVFIALAAVLTVAVRAFRRPTLSWQGLRLKPGRPSVLAVSAILALLGGMARGCAVQPPSPVLAPFVGQRVGAVVDLGRVIRRDAGEVSAEAVIRHLEFGQSSVAGTSGSRVTVRCMPGREPMWKGSCPLITRGAVLAVRGTGGWSSSYGSSIVVSGSSAIVRVARTGLSRRSGHGVDPVDAVRARVTFLAMEKLGGAAAWLAPALVLGEGRGVPSAPRNALSVLGTAHVISVSGLHVVAASGAVGVFVYILFGLPASRFRRRMNVAAIAAGSSVVSVWLVAAVAGFPPPAIRASGMATALVASRFLSRRVPPACIVASTGLAEMLAWPEDAASISFQLSYGAVFGIIAAAACFGRRESRGRKGIVPGLLAALRGSLLVSIGASAATLPLTILYFGSAPLIGPIANIAIIPMFTFIGLPGSFLVLAILALNPGAVAGTGPCGLAMKAFSWSADLMINLQVRFARLVPEVLSYPSPPLDVAVAACVTGAFAWFIAGKGRRGLAIAAAAALAITLLPAWRHPQQGEAVFFNVGKGDAALVRCPSGVVWLVDAGPVPPPGRSLLLPALARAGVHRVDGVIVTHAHDDHFGGVPELVDVQGPLELAASPSTIDAMGDLPGIVREAGGSVRVLKTGDQAIPGCGMDTRIIASELGLKAAQHENEKFAKNLNNDSVVFRLGTPAEGILFVGDLEREGEEMLMAGGDGLRSAVLKTGHHGSPGASSARFIRSVAPITAIITGWPAGPRKGPADAVLARFNQQKCRVMATTLLGDVTVQLPGSLNEKSPSEPVFKPQTFFPEDFGGRDVPARSITRPVKVRSSP